MANTSNIKLHAGNAVELESGIDIQEGCYFEAYIEPFYTCEQFPNGRIGIRNNQLPVDTNFNFTNSNTSMLKLNPIPAKSEIHIEYNLLNDVNIILFDNLGNLIQFIKKDEIQNKGVHAFDYSLLNLPFGTYFVTLLTENTKQTIKLIKE